MAAVVLVDTGFSEQLWSEDENRYWNQAIGYGKLRKRIEDAWVKIGATPEQVEYLKGIRSVLNSKFSPSVHSSLSSAFACYVGRRLREPEVFARRAYLGYISESAPMLIGSVTRMVKTFGVTVMEALTSEITELFGPRVSLSEQGLHSFCAAAFMLENLLTRYEEDLVAYEENLADRELC